MSPTARLDLVTSERVAALEADKARLMGEVARLQGKFDALGPENARLAEALANAESNGALATTLITLGGFAVSYATYAGLSAKTWADLAAGCLLAGIVVMLWQSARRALGRRPRG